MSRNVAADTLTEIPACAAPQRVGTLQIRRSVAARHWTATAFAARHWVTIVTNHQNAATHVDRHIRAALKRVWPLRMKLTVAARHCTTAVLAYAAGIMVMNARMTKIAAAAAHVSPMDGQTIFAAMTPNITKNMGDHGIATSNWGGN